MGYIKKNDSLMKIVIIILFGILFNNCEKNKSEIIVQNTSISKKNMQTINFDIEKYESNIKKNPLYEGFQKDENTYVKQYHIIKDGYVEDGYSKNIIEHYVEEFIGKDRYKTKFTFNKNGNLESKKKYFGNNLEIGKWEYFKNGVLSKTENKDENFSFGLDDVLKFGKKNNIDFQKTGEISRQFSKEFNKYIWELTWNTEKLKADGKTYIFRKVILSGLTGEKLYDKEYDLNPLRR
ncbi:hypothetical protein SAMN05443633_101137 [Chryseobacterium arachidis]|uniref:MORN repeat variant n=3 Tax=Chryseobacterium arachidis TaxID=1416778 RepID=A0A1M4T2H6_9FLAO|nr:hypothetical protein SAMN05443633_101137 [Chryseobacterium arachidis]